MGVSVGGLFFAGFRWVVEGFLVDFRWVFDGFWWSFDGFLVICAGFYSCYCSCHVFLPFFPMFSRVFPPTIAFCQSKSCQRRAALGVVVFPLSPTVHLHC